MPFFLPLSDRTSEITCYAGPNGAGKTALAVTHGWQKSNGKTFYCNLDLIPPNWWKGEVVKITSLDQIESLENGHILIDEITAALPSRGTMNLPTEFGRKISTLRHDKLSLGYTSPVFEHADINLRRVTRDLIEVESILTKKIEGETWRKTVLSMGKRRNVQNWETEATSSTMKPPLINNGYVYLNALELDSYDTEAHVPLIADHLQCLECGGNLRKEYCKENGKHEKKEENK